MSKTEQNPCEWPWGVKARARGSLGRGIGKRMHKEKNYYRLLVMVALQPLLLLLFSLSPHVQKLAKDSW